MNNIAPPIDDTKFCKILLYGHVPLLDITNKKIILHTIYYIKCTKRFDTLEAFNQQATPQYFPNLCALCLFCYINLMPNSSTISYIFIYRHIFIYIFIFYIITDLTLFVYIIHVNCPFNLMFLMTYQVADALMSSPYI